MREKHPRLRFTDKRFGRFFAHAFERLNGRFVGDVQPDVGRLLTGRQFVDEEIPLTELVPQHEVRDFLLRRYRQKEHLFPPLKNAFIQPFTGIHAEFSAHRADRQQADVRNVPPAKVRCFMDAEQTRRVADQAAVHIAGTRLFGLIYREKYRRGAGCQRHIRHFSLAVGAKGVVEGCFEELRFAGGVVHRGDDEPVPAIVHGAVPIQLIGYPL